LFRSVADSIISANQTVNGEFYMSQAIEALMERGFPVYGFEVAEPKPLGTPEYLEQYKLRRIANNIEKIHGAKQSFVPFEETVQLHYEAVPTKTLREARKIKTTWTVDQKQDEAYMDQYRNECEQRQLRICIDIDGTINHTKKPSEAYGNELPQDMAPSTIREWKKRGHYIILHTARHMNTCSANVGQVVARIAESTIQWLRDNDIPYEELHFGKPHADIFIDDAAYCHYNWLDTQKVVEKLERKGGRFSSEYHQIAERNKKK